MCSQRTKSKNTTVLDMLFLMLTLASAEPHFTFCSDTTANYTPGSPFEKNLKSLLESLSSDTSLKDGFYGTSVGNGSDSLFGQALCRGDVTPKACQKCVVNASQDITEECQSEDAIIWYELCQIRYSYQMFFSSMVYTGKYPDSNNMEKNVSNQDHFQVVYSLMNELSEKAAYDASNLMFATGKVKYSQSETIFGLVQCTRDISRDNCRSCFTQALGDLEGRCKYREGGTVFSRNCNVRFEMYPFYKDPKGGKWKMWVVVAVACASSILVAVLTGSYVLHRWQRKAKQIGDEKGQSSMLNYSLTPVNTTMAWQLRNEGHELEFVDPLLTEQCPTLEVLRCIHIALLCVQEDPAERPTMSNVVVLLGSESIALPEPSKPAFSVGRAAHHIDQSVPEDPSVNQLTLSGISAR
ncbi:hypothetical protein RJ639_032611 [Escallonia herrerae]|uniref:Gnk2-homologous domain-containing protein n=1 Tax=Escallonia herrerae TaxID=1293975 RepID=A0AA88WXC7_9ASTE|nr:hypothetical protein RJ639_032611 [Escallonia herrerae]